MPPVLRGGSYLTGVLAFFLGGTLFVMIEYISAHMQSSSSKDTGNSVSIGLFTGILVDLLIDGVLIGVGSTLSLNTGLLLAIGLSLSTAPLAFVTTATAKRQGVPRKDRQLLSILFLVCIIAGAILGYALFRDLSEAVRLTLIALAAGFLITTVTQSMIPEANREGEPSFAGILYMAGLSLYVLMSLTIQ
jgi:ZIP family zinc transporter